MSNCECCESTEELKCFRCYSYGTCTSHNSCEAKGQYQLYPRCVMPTNDMRKYCNPREKKCICLFKHPINGYSKCICCPRLPDMTMPPVPMPSATEGGAGGDGDPIIPTSTPMPTMEFSPEDPDNDCMFYRIRFVEGELDGDFNDNITVQFFIDTYYTPLVNGQLRYSNGTQVPGIHQFVCGIKDDNGNLLMQNVVDRITVNIIDLGEDTAGTAKPTGDPMRRGQYYIPVKGDIEMPSSDFNPDGTFISAERRDAHLETVMHELFHAMGVGFYWEDESDPESQFLGGRNWIIQDDELDYSNLNSTYYSLRNETRESVAVAEYNKIFGTNTDKIPAELFAIENTQYIPPQQGDPDANPPIPPQPEVTPIQNPADKTNGHLGTQSRKCLDDQGNLVDYLPAPIGDVMKASDRKDTQFDAVSRITLGLLCDLGYFVDFSMAQDYKTEELDVITVCDTEATTQLSSISIEEENKTIFDAENGEDVPGGADPCETRLRSNPEDQGTNIYPFGPSTRSAYIVNPSNADVLAEVTDVKHVKEGKSYTITNNTNNTYIFDSENINRRPEDNFNGQYVATDPNDSSKLFVRIEPDETVTLNVTSSTPDRFFLYVDSTDENDQWMGWYIIKQ